MLHVKKDIVIECRRLQYAHHDICAQLWFNIQQSVTEF